MRRAASSGKSEDVHQAGEAMEDVKEAERAEEKAEEASEEKEEQIQPALSQEQVNDLAELETVTRRHLSYLDYSPTGTGKTRVTCQLAKNYGLSLFVVCPKPAKNVWLDEARVVGAKIVEVISFGKLAGKVGCRLSHPYLLRVADEKREGQYKVTPDFTRLVAEGIILVLDEAHHGKNITTCIHAAFSALSRYIAQTGGSSRIGLISATIVDKAGLQCMAAVDLLGLAPLPMYIQRPGRPIELKGFRQLLAVAAQLDPRAMEKIKSRFAGHRWTAAQVADEVSRIFVQIAIPSLGSTMCPVIYKGIKRHYFYKYFDLDPEAREGYDEACKNIEEATRELVGKSRYIDRAEREPPAPVKRLFGIIAQWLVELDCLLVDAVLRQARQWLEADPGCKVIICLNVIRCRNPRHRPQGKTGGNHIAYFMDQLAQYGPICYTGEVNEKERQAGIDSFQAPDTTFRVLVATSSSLKESISLHDISGTAPVAVQVIDGEEVEISANSAIFGGGSRRVDPKQPDLAPCSKAPEPQPRIPGRFPRKAIVMPSYRMTEIHQIAGRFYRFGVSSDVELAIALGKGKRELRSILNSLASKSALLAMITHHAEMGVIFPGDYEVEIEGMPPLSPEEQAIYRGDPSRLLQVFQS